MGTWACSSLSVPRFPHLRNGDAETHALIMRKKGADTYMQRTQSARLAGMLQFSTPNSGALSSWGPCTGDAGETQGPSDPSQYRQEADSASLERLPSRPARRLVGQDGVGLGSAEWRDREGQVPGAYEQVAARHSPARWDLPHPPGPGLSGKAGSPRGLSACSGLIISAGPQGHGAL